MAKFKYVGDPNDKFSGPDVIFQYGQSWKKGGEAVDVPEETLQDLKHIQTLTGNSHFVDMSDKDQRAEVEARQKAIEKAAADKAKADAEQQRRDDADRKQAEKHAANAGVAADGSPPGPRPPGNVTREPAADAFGGRTVEQRTRAEDHTSAGKTK